MNITSVVLPSVLPAVINPVTCHPGITSTTVVVEEGEPMLSPDGTQMLMPDGSPMSGLTQ